MSESTVSLGSAVCDNHRYTMNDEISKRRRVMKHEVISVMAR